MKQLREELGSYEEVLVERTMRALTGVNAKLQKQVTQFVNLKMRIAFLKSGIQQELGVALETTPEDFFKAMEDQILLKLDDVDFKYEPTASTFEPFLGKPSTTRRSSRKKSSLKRVLQDFTNSCSDND